MKLLILVSAVLAVSLAADFEAVVKQEWQLYKAQHGKQYRSSFEDLRRMQIYMENRALIAAHNAKYEKGEVTYKMALNQFSDLTHEEFRVRMGLFNHTMPHLPSGHSYVTPSNAQLPSSVNWIEKGAVTPVKDQGGCGSCWSFSTTGSIEGQGFIKKGKLVSLSEQNLVDCSKPYGPDGCGGGWMWDAMNYVKANGGIDTEESYPYEGSEGSCRYNAQYSGASITGYTRPKSGSEADLQSAVANIGPISVAFDASLSSFMQYSGGIYYDSQCRTDYPVHAVLVVGYGTEGGQDYWLVKNSWNTWWGDKGYFKIARNKNNHCGIANWSVYPNL